MANTRDGSRANASAHSDFFAETLEHQNRGVGSHTDGKDNTCDARQRKREQAERRKRSQKTEIEHGEHSHSSSRKQAQAVIEEQQVQHNQGKTQDSYDQAAVERILAKRRTYNLALLIVEAYRQRTAFKNRLERLSFFERVLPVMEILSARDFRLNRRSGLDLTVQDNDNLAIGGSKIARCIGKRLSTSRIERDVNRIVLAGFRRLVYRNTRNVLARNEGRIGAWVNAAVRCLARLEGIAEIIGNRALLHVGAVLDGGLVVSFGEESARANSSLPVLPMVARAVSGSERPGIWTRI